MTKRSQKQTFTRRTVLTTAGAAAAGLSGLTVFSSSVSAQTKKIKVTLPWLPDSNYSYAFVAKNQGFWAKRGLDVEISRGNGALTAGQAVHSGQFDFGIIPVAGPLLLAARGLDLQTIGQVDYNASMGIALMEDSPIRKPKDLEGRTVGQTVSSSDAAFFPVFCDRMGVDIKKVNVVSLDANVRTRTLWDRKVDAITGFFNSILPASVGAGMKTRYMLYANYGIDLYSDSATVKAEMLRDNPRLCEAFVDGLHEGVKFHMTQPEETLKIYLKEVKEMAMSATAEDFARVGIKILMYSLQCEPGVATHGLGWVDNKKAEEMIDLVMKYQAPKEAVRPSREHFFQTQFAGRQRLTPAEWKAAEEYYKDISDVARAAS